MKQRKTSSNDPSRFTALLAGVAGQPVKLILTALLLTGLAHQAAAQTWSLGGAWSAANGVGHLANTGNNRGVAYGAVSNQVFVATRNGSSSAIDVFDGTAGTLLSGVGGVNGASTVAPDQIGVGDDGVLYAMPLATSVAAGSPQIYSWTNWNSTPYLAYQGASGDPVVTAFSGKRIGDTIAVTGSGVNTLIVAGVGASANYVLFHTADGVNFTPTAITNITGLPTTAGNIFGIAFYTNGTFLVLPGVNASGHNVYLVSYPANFASQTGVTGTLLGSAGTFTTNSTYALNYAPAGKMLAVASTASVGPDAIGIFSLTNFPTSAGQLATTNFATPNANGNATGGVALGGQGKTNYLYVLESNNGLQAYMINFTAAPQPVVLSGPSGGVTNAYPPQTLTVTASGTLPIHYQWYVISGGTTNPVGANTNFYTVTTPVTNTYFVIVTNSVNAVTSSVVGLSLLTPVTNSVVSQLWSAPIGAPAFLANDNNTRGIAYDTNLNRVVVASMSGGVGLYILDGNAGSSLGSLSTSGMYAGATFTVDQVGIADDGAVYAGNLAQAGQTFALTQWPAATNTAAGYQAYPGGDPGSGSGDRWGDTMAVRGAGTGTQILLGSKGTNVVLFTTPDGTNFTPTLIAITNVPSGFAGNGVAFGAGNTFWATKYSGDLYEIAFNLGIGTGGAVLDFTAGSQFPSAMTGVGVDQVNNILASINLSDINNDLRLFQLTGTADPPVMFDQAFFPSYNVNGNANAAIVMKYPRVYALDVNNGIVAVTYGVPATTAPVITTPPASATAYTNDPAVTLSVTVSGSLPLYYQWQFNGTNISGATSQSYTLHYPPLSAAGSYDVVVHNVAGSQTSTPPAVLTLLTPTVSTVVTQQWTLAAGSRSYLDASSYYVRGLAYDTNTGTLLLCDHSVPNIYVLNAANGSDLFTLNTAGLPNVGLSGFILDQIGVADDGVVYGGNLADTTSSEEYALISWSSVSSGATLNYAYGGATGGDPGNGSGDRWGDTMAVRGSGTNTEILIGSYTGTNVVLFTTPDGINFTPYLIPVTGTPAVPAGFSSLGIAFGAGDTFWAKGGHNYNLRQVSFNRVSWTGTVLETFNAGTQVPNDLTGLGVDVAANILGGVCFNDTPNDLQLYELSGNANPPALFNQAFFGSNNANAQENAATTLKGGLGFALDVNNGLTAISYGAPPAPPVTITSVSYQAGTGVTINWNNCFNGHNYQVVYKNALTNGTWKTLGSPVNAVGLTASFIDTSPLSAARYYRVQSE
ncbi:MAG: immunoglobulin domain-containing protein [Verrucomicrobiota bacterium]|jgi:hypothetical protein